MAARPITTAAVVLAKNPGIDSAQINTTELSRCIDAASALLEKWCNRIFVEATYAALHSGERALRIRDDEGRAGTRLYLADPVTRLLTMPVSAVSSCTEDGTAITTFRLSTAPTFTDGDYGALVSDARGIVTRVSIAGGEITPVPWAPGVANIKVAYTAGYKTSGSTEPLIPADLVEACCHLTWLLFNEGPRSGAESMSEAGTFANYSRLLVPSVADAIKRYALPMSPMTLEA